MDQNQFQETKFNPVEIGGFFIRISMKRSKC